MARLGWVFVDSPDVTLQVNPNADSGSLAVLKEISYSNTAGPDGKTLIYETGTEMPTVSFDGFIYTEAQYDVLAAEVEKDLSQMTDDRGVQYDIIWDSFTMQRADNVKYPWRHSYSITGKVLDYTIPA